MAVHPTSIYKARKEELMEHIQHCLEQGLVLGTPDLIAIIRSGGFDEKGVPMTWLDKSRRWMDGFLSESNGNQEIEKTRWGNYTFYHRPNVEVGSKEFDLAVRRAQNYRASNRAPELLKKRSRERL